MKKLKILIVFCFVISCSRFHTYSPTRNIAESSFVEKEKLIKIYSLPAYRELLKDMVFELDHYDGVDKEFVEIIELKESLKSLIETGNAENFFNSLSEEWLKFFQLERVEQIDKGFNSEKIITEKEIYQRHTIPNLDRYISDRIGPQIVDSIQADNVDVYVNGGNASHIGSVFGKADLQLIEIPSLYSSWGIDKYVDLSSIEEGKPKVYFNIPPIYEYVKHYGRMLSELGKTSNVEINLDDRKNLQELFQKEIDELFNRHEIKQQAHITLGYQNTLSELIDSGELNQWDIVSTEKLSTTTELGINAKKHILRNKNNNNVTIEIISLACHSTLWGEASSFLTKGVLSHNPKTFTFMGSAGLIDSGLGNHYDASIPKTFFQKVKKITIENFVHAHKKVGGFFRKNIDKIIWGTIHSHSNTPSEQSDTWFKNKLKNGVDSIDVEVSLVADEVLRHNDEKFASVQFGVINLVTDKPSVDEHHSVGLSQIDQDAKKMGKIRIVENYLDTISSLENYIYSFDDKLKESIKKFFPNIKDSDIKLANGVGKIDASDDHKLSYYIHSENPNTPGGKVVLIPMATSRFDRYNYHTDEWWNKYGEAYSKGETVPMEDPRDVAKYLRENGLSTNPEVYIFEDIEEMPKKIKLKEYLLSEYLKKYSRNGYVYLYRGISKSNEISVWKSKVIPRGVRYWTPDINYAWRYGRKRDDLIEGLIKGESPMAKFKIPERDFIQMVRGNEIVLGTELPKSAHTTFERDRFFKDNLTGFPYLGSESSGVEFEIRARRKGRKKLVHFFEGSVNARELAKDRIKKIQSTYKRMIVNDPHKREQLKSEMEKRIKTVQLELDIINASQLGEPDEVINRLVSEYQGMTKEISHTSRESLAEKARSLKGSSSIRGGRLNCSKLIFEILR